jgi:predicted N-acetyltransferase YhbS
MLELRLATPEESRSRDALNFTAWGAPQLSREQYLRREEFLRGTAWAGANLRSWVLVSDGEVVASCETYRMRSRAWGKDGVAQGVASVFVEDRLRRRGYAERMMRLLVERLRSEGAQASILFSEVGVTLYGRCGYLARPTTTRAWPAERATPRVQVLDSLALPVLLEEADRRALRFRIRASLEQLDWHFARAEYYRKVLGGLEPRARALRVGAAWAILCPNLRSRRLTLLELEPGSVTENMAVVEAAADEAARLDLEEVTVIENEFNAASLPPGVRRECDEGVPMILPLAPGLRAEEWRDVVRGVWV